MKKALNIIKNVLVWAFVALAVFMTVFTIVSVTTFDRNDRNLFGFRAYIVKTDSMSKTDFDAGDLIFVKDVDRSTLKAGDIITYISQNSNSFGETITHKIREKVVDAEGKPGFITYGTTTDTNDETIVTYPFIMGKYVGKIANLGHFFNFLKTTQGYILCIFVPFMLLIVYQAINFFNLFRRYKGEQMAAMQAERDEIEAQRAENAKMLEELQALKAQLAGDKPEVEATTEAEVATEAEN
ncbi:MAG: signal peptidase I [Clostridia bacterium]|nr:signal peptidase I [Clostridia bacterium]